MVQIMFETFNTPATYLTNSALLALFASGRTSGVVVGSGYEISYCSAFFEGKNVGIRPSILGLGGSELTEHLRRMIWDGQGKLPLQDREVTYINNVKKEKLCYVAHNFDEECSKIHSNPSMWRTYELPNGSTITLRDERIKCPEALFNPYLVGNNSEGIHEQCYECIKRCSSHIQQLMYENIVLEGGSTMFPGFANRLQTEITLLAPPTMKIKVIAPPERKYSAWIGGSLVASLPNFQQKFISMQEYDECGPSIVHQKCSQFL